MNTYDAVMTAENMEELTPDVIEAWQHLINTGICWQLQGWFGRHASHLIEQGLCTPPT